MTTPHFETVYTTFETPMLQDAYQAITACDLWEWMRTYAPEDGRGFMFGNHPNQEKINEKMTYTGHSGASYGWTMRAMEDIAKNGWDSHKNRVRQARALGKLEQWASKQRKPNNPCPCRSTAGFRDGWCAVAGGGVPACDH
jgi:hypothetical protein